MSCCLPFWASLGGRHPLRHLATFSQENSFQGRTFQGSSILTRTPPESCLVLYLRPDNALSHNGATTDHTTMYKNIVNLKPTMHLVIFKHDEHVPGTWRSGPLRQVFFLQIFSPHGLGSWRNLGCVLALPQSVNMSHPKTNFTHG